MIRVLQVMGGLERGGAETLVMNWLRAIDREKIQFDFVIHTPTKGAHYEEIRSLGGKIYHCPRYTGKNHMQYKRWWKSFLAEHPEYTIVHGHARSTASIYLKIAAKLGRKAIAHSHSTSSGSGLAALIKRILQLPLRYRSYYLMACSNEAGRWLFGSRACRSDRYLLLPNSADISHFCFDAQIRDEYRKMLGIENCFVLGHVGRFHEAKNHLFLLEVFNELHNKNENSRLLLVGDGELRWQIEERIRQLGLTDSVILTGSRGNVSDYLQAMDVFVFPSLWEGLPVSVIEAQAASLPCLISDTITMDVNITEQIRRLPIQSTAPWMKALTEEELFRKDVTDDIKKAGFDVQDSVKKLTKFYEMIGE